MEGRLTVAAVFARMGAIGRANAGPTAAAVALLLAAGVAADTLAAGSGINIVLNIATFFASWFVQKGALERLGLRDPAAPPRLGAMFGVNLLSGLGILLGLVVLVLPGLFLSARWWIVDPIVLSDETSTSDALGRSWAATREHVWTIMLVLVILAAPAFLLVLFASFLTPEASVINAVLVNVAIYLWSATSWWSQVAVFSLLDLRRPGLADVFA